MSPRLVHVLAQVLPVERVQSEFLDRGLLGVTVVALAAVLVYLWRDLREREAAWRLREKVWQDAVAQLQAQRVADFQSFASQQLAVNRETVAALTNGATGMETVRDSLGEVKVSLERLGDRIERLERPPRR